jgi:hypothetical protein
MLSPSLVILSEALDRPVQGEAKNLCSSLRVNSAKHPRSFMEKTTAETLRPSADGLRVTGRRCFTFFGNAAPVSFKARERAVDCQRQTRLGILDIMGKCVAIEGSQKSPVRAQPDY